MLTRDEVNRLSRLLNHLHLLTGVKFALMDENGKEAYTSSDRGPFCRLIAGEEEGVQRCYACDRQAVAQVLQTKTHCKYLCHAGLYEICMPVMENGEVAAIILFGQMLDDAPRDAQWQRIRTRCAWYGDMDGLHEEFLKLRRISAEQINACMEIVRACVSEVRLHGLHAVDTRDDAMRLKLFIDAHYAEPLDADRLAAALHVGKTKLYAVCRKRFQMTPMQLVAQVRMAAAQELLANTTESVKAISQAVGIGDANYFAKVFRSQTGLSPVAYRQSQNQG